MRVKRLLDVALSATGLLLAIPISLVTVLAIGFESGFPVLYKQKRMGHNEEEFWLVKFRSMRQGAEEGSGAVWAKRDDDRVTKVGRLIRLLRVDEIPQMWNVLKGEMSVVGPRPLAVSTKEMEELEKIYGVTARKRMNMLPGITGLWQVSGRSEVSGDQRFALDLYYVEHWSLGLDLKIILRTIPVVLFGKGAY